MAKPGWRQEITGDVSGAEIRIPHGNQTRTDGDLTNLAWLHEDRNLLRNLQLVKEAGVRTGAPGDIEESQEPVGGREDCPGKPPFSFSSLIFMAIEGSQSKCLPVKDIYSWIINTFPYYKGASLGWKNSVRHNLSLSKCFRKVPTDSAKIDGKGSLWCVEPKFRHLLIDGLRKNWCGQKSDTPRQDALNQILQDHHATEQQECLPCQTGGGAEGYRLPHGEDHNYSIVNIQMVSALSGGGEQVLVASSPVAPVDGGCLELVVFADHTGSRLDWCFEAMGLVEVDSEAREAAGSLLHLAGIQY